MSIDADLYPLPEEHQQLRAAVPASHISEAYPGVGAGALTTCIWIIGGACRRHERSASGASR